MLNSISVLCVHGVGHGDLDANLQPTWREAITTNLQRWQPKLKVDCQFFLYDDIFDHEPLNPVVYGKALAELLASGVIHGVGDLFGATRGLLDVPDQIRWTAGMVAQWASEPDLRSRLRRKLTAAVNAGDYSLICAHSRRPVMRISPRRAAATRTHVLDCWLHFVMIPVAAMAYGLNATDGRAQPLPTTWS